MHAFRLISILAAAVSVSMAQITTGTITGILTDPSGAAIPGASIELTNSGTLAVRTTLSSDSGEYLFSFLTPGTYSVKTEMKGFRSVLRRDVTVQVSVVTRVDTQMEPSTIEQVIEVSGTPPPLQTETGEVGGVVERTTVLNLPLNGRSFTQLVALQPGGVSTGKLPGGGLNFFTLILGGSFSVHGAPVEATNYLLDGIDMKDAVDTRVGFVLTVDAIQEFKFQAANYSAAFGRGSGGHINVASRAGTNDLHGAVWEFLRNDKLDARSFFDPFRPAFRQNQFGGALGGPIRKDRTFFYTTYEGFRQRKGVTRVVSVPSTLQRTGNFTEGPAIYDPFTTNADGTRVPFGGSLIPASLHSPISIKSYDLLFPTPTAPGLRNNLTGVATQKIDSDQFNVRVDQRLGAKDSLFGRFTYARVDRDFPFVFSALPNFSSVWNSPARNAVFSETHVFGPRTVNEFKAGYNRHTQILEDRDQTVPVNQTLGIPGLTTDPRFQGNPTLAITGFGSTGAISNAPNNRSDNAYVLLDNVSHLTGSHSISTGIQLQRNEQNGGANPNSHGVFSFNGTFTSQLNAAGAVVSGTGNPAADFLLGYPASTNRCCTRGDGFRNFRKIDFGIYLQDDWKVRPNLTLNLGIRWEYFQPATESSDRYSQPDLTAAPATKILLAGQNGVSRSMREGDFNNLAPRFGFAYNVGKDKRTVVRGAYGIFFNPPNLVYTFSMSANPPFVDLDSFLSTVRTPQLSLSNPFPSNLGIPSLSFTGVDNKLRDSYGQHWNLSIQRDIGWSTVLSAGYIGDKGTKLYLVANENAPEPGPGAVNPRRPVPGLAAVSIRSNRARSSYHALELKAERRFTAGLGFLTSYVWAKCIDVAGVQVIGDGSPAAFRDPRSIAMNRGLCQANISHRSVTSFVWDMPFAKGAHGAKGILASNWRSTSIITIEGGQPFTVALPFDNSNTGRGGDTPDVVDGQKVNDGPKTANQWFNTAAFRAPAPLTYGNAGRSIVIGPGLSRVDFSVHKDFKFSESRALEFRTEVFNIFNHPGFFQPGNTFGTPNFAVIGGAFDGRDIQFSLKFKF